MNTSKTLLATAALALSGLAQAVEPSVSHLGLLTEFPAQFAVDSQETIQARDFFLAQRSDLTGALKFENGVATFRYVTLEWLGPLPVLFPAAVGEGAKPLPPFTELVGSGTGYNFQFKGLETGHYRLQLGSPFGSGAGRYNGAIYATPAVPEPESVLLLLAGVGVAGVVVRRRQA
ncbi:MAG: hypothetical protein C0487_12170 [Leptothrix sp. (in: Bacteria)]|nr:hypothetical protein [Leptothrix sp. (in: b-proteobacteria)]